MTNSNEWTLKLFSCCVYKFFNDKGNTYDSLEKSYVK